MKDKIFSFIWAALCAWVTVQLLAWLNVKLNLTEVLFMPSVMSFCHSHGLPFRRILFWSITLLYWFTGTHKFLGHALLITIGYAVLLIVAIVVVLILYHFMVWLTATV